VELGLVFFDTADVYKDGGSERVLGAALKGKRDTCVIATKFGYDTKASGGSRKAIRIAVEASLRRLETEYIDLYQMHAPDPVTPIEETISTLQELVHEGKVLYFGLCNFDPWQLVDAQHVARALDGPSVLSIQSPLNAVNLTPYRAARPVLEKFNVGMLAASPLARGLLGRDYTFGNPPPETHPLWGRKGVVYWSERGISVALRLRETARRRGETAASVALQLLLSLPGIISVLARPRVPDDLRDYSDLSDLGLTRSEINYIVYGT